MFAFQDTLGPVEIAFTDRHGGTSGGPFASLNLAEPGTTPAGAEEADPAAERAAVRRNVDLAVRAFAGVDPAAPTPPVVRMRQVHGADVHVVTAGDERRRPRDGLVTAERGTVLMVRVADCVPVLLADAGHGIVAAVHAGRPGLAAGRGAGRRRGDARRWAPSRLTRLGRARTCAAPATRCPTGCGPRSARSCPSPTPRPRGARPRWTSAPGCAAQLARRRVRGRRRVALHRRGRGPVLLPPPGPALRPAGRPGPGAAVIPARARARRARRATSSGSAARIADAAGRSGRSADEVTLTVVTKFFPASDVRLLADLGVRHVGENRHQEAEAKAAECADLGLTWHFIGGLQSNKAAAVATYADVVESVDRAKLLRGLSVGRPPARPRRGRPGPGEPRHRTRRRWSCGGPARRRRPARRAGRRGRRAAAPRGDGGRAAGGGSPACVRETRRDRLVGAPDRAVRDLDLGRDERRPRSRRRIRRDTRADRQCGAR